MSSIRPATLAFQWLRSALLVGAVVLAASTVSSSRAAAQDFTVIVQSGENYTVNGQFDPPLTLTRGRSYTFAVNAPGHPFFIKTSPGPGTGAQWNDGVTNNGLSTGTLTFAVPANAPNQLFYQCSVHDPMSGVINVVSAPSTPSGGPWMAAALFALLAAAGTLMLRGRRSTRRAL